MEDEQTVSEALESLIAKGIVEVAGVNERGELTYGIVGATPQAVRPARDRDAQA